MNRLRGQAWLCEPSSETLRDAISHLGKGGYLELPPTSFRAAHTTHTTRLQSLPTSTGVSDGGYGEAGSVRSWPCDR